MKKVLIALFAFALVFSACEEDTEQLPVNTLEANAGDDQQATTNQLLTLDGSKSKDLEKKTFQYLWNIKSKPANSVAALTDATTVNPTFTPDKAGTYVIELKIHNETFGDSDEVSIVVTEPNNQSVVLNQDINQEQRLTNIFTDPAVPDYIVTEDIHVTGRLLLDPSVTIAFEAGKAMYIDDPGSIDAIAWGNKDIIFTGKTKSPGYWKGLIINSPSVLNKMERVIIEYGGSSPANGMEFPANLALTSKGNLNLVAATIQHSASYGMIVESGANWSADSFSNIFRGNQIPLRLPVSQVSSVDGLSYFTDNIKNVVEVTGGRISDLMEMQWGPALTMNTPAGTVPYHIKGDINVTSGLKIHKGVELQFDSDIEFTVVPTGYLKAIGTASEPIIFRGRESAEGGFWRGIVFKSNNDQNELSYVEISDAGSEYLSGADKMAAIVLDGANHAKLKLTNSKIRKNGGYGLFAENYAELTGFTFNQFENNAAAAVALPANEVRKVNNMVATSFTGNGHDGIEIYGSLLLLPDNEESVWPALGFGATYLVRGFLGIATGLKILPGAAFKFTSGKGLVIVGNGYLNAQGTDELKIVFTGVNETKGFWNGIHFRTNSDLNVLSKTRIQYAGMSNQPGIPAASIHIGENYVSKLKITQSTIAHGEGYGIAIDTNLATINSDFETANQFEDLTLGNVLKTAP
jgi:PKD repeat protein